MTGQELLHYVDHTLLAPGTTVEDIDRICREGLQYHTASVCIPPQYVAYASRHYPELSVCTVVGFPLGYEHSGVKGTEAAQAVADGASEVDMVISIGALLSGDYDYVRQDIAHVRRSIPNSILKVIVETCYLSEGRLIDVCHMVSDSGADFIKTSTGFGTGGATLESVQIMKENIAPHVRIKAAGGIRTVEDMLDYVQAGCARIGSSSAVNLLKDRLTETV